MSVNIKGLSELQAFLDTLPVKMEQNIMRAAIRAGANVIKADAKIKCPVGPPSAEGVRLYKHYEGALRDSIRSGAFAKGGRVTGYVRAGGKNKKTGADVWYAPIIEFTGAKAHKISAKPGSALSFGGGLVKSVNHPGMRAQPFMRPAMDAQMSNAVVAVAEYIKKRLATKNGLDTSAVEILGE